MDANPADAALATYAAKVTTDIRGATRADVEALRTAGLDDRAIHDATQVIAYFNYINRIASALGIPDEPEWEADQP